LRSKKDEFGGFFRDLEHKKKVTPQSIRDNPGRYYVKLNKTQN